MKVSSRIAEINGKDKEDDGWSVLYKARDMIAAGRAVTMLCIGDHDLPTPPAIIAATKAALDEGRTRYAAVNGTESLRREIARRVSARSGVETGPDAVFVASGGQGALLAAIMGATDPGDTVIVIDPYYATYPATVHAAACHMRIVAADPDRGFQIAPEALFAAAEGARAILINTPHNPTGAVYDATTLDAIREICTTKDIWCISDEVYDTQIHNGAHVSPRMLPGMADRSLVVGSLSKSHIMTGFRLGWLIGPEHFIGPLTDLTNATTYGAPGFIQDAAVVALRDCAEAEAATAATYTARRNAALAALNGTNALKVSPPDGAMYVMLDIRATGLSGEAFAHRLLDREAIALMPGESFGRAAAGHVRVALTQPEEVLVPALRQVARFAQSLTKEQ